MVFRRNAIAALRPASPEKIRISADYYWAFGAHMIGGTVRMERALGYYRIHGTNLWANNGYFGSGSALGFLKPEITETIRSALTESFCAAAPGLERPVGSKHLARAFVNYVRLARSDQAA